MTDAEQHRDPDAGDPDTRGLPALPPRPGIGSRHWLTPGVGAIGLSSLGSDAGHEMTTSLLPSFLSSTLHAGPAALGAIEGVSDALVGLSKLAGGPLSVDPRRRGRIASGGYLVTAFATSAIGFATAVWQVAVLRGLAWVSRGLRSPARDSMLMSLVPREAYGRAGGVERAGDNLGALIGPLIAAALIGWLGIRTTLVLAFIPGLLAAAAITFAAREARHALGAASARARLSFNFHELRRAGMVRALTPATLFEVGNLASTLLILRATDLLHTDHRSLTAATSTAILLYAGHNAVAAAASLGGGWFIDRVGSPQPPFALGAAVYVVSYTVFGWGPHSVGLLALAFATAGVGIGLAETAESTTVALALPDRLRGNGFGLLGLVQSFGDLGATLVAGVVWSVWSATLAFAYATAWMVASTITALVLRAPTRDHDDSVPR
ncbi:MAG: MFS transporter [Nocardioides sp.]